jgi:multidrug efflux pump subunit AcrA (membrane-fusion protein)
MTLLGKRWVGSVCAILLIGALSACSKEEEKSEPVVSVQVEIVKASAIERTISSEAVLYPIQQASITPKITAPVKRFYVNRGSKVKAGQLLATLENNDLAASEAENKGSLTQAEAAYAATTTAGVPEEVQKAELDFEGAKQNLDAEQKLHDSRENLYKQGALPRKDLDQSRVSLTQARNQYAIAQKHLASLRAVGKEQELKSAEGQLQSARGKYLGAQAQLDYSEIRSPINGVVAERPLYPGETAAAGAPLLVVMNIAKVIAKTHIPAQDAALLKVGDPATIISPATAQKIPARITVVSPATDPNSTTVEIWAEADNPKDVLRPGTTAQLSIVAQKLDKVLVVPSSSLLSQPDGSKAVMLVGSDYRAHLQTVQMGIQSGEQTEITSGLKSGQQVIVTGGFGLPDNTQVKIESSSGAATPQPASD